MNRRDSSDGRRPLATMVLALLWGCAGQDDDGRSGVVLAGDRDEAMGAACRPGLNPGAPTWDGQVVLDDGFADALAATGAASVRLDFRRGSGGWDDHTLAQYDGIVDRLLARGLAVHGLVTYEAISAPQWVWNDDEDGDGVTDATGEFADTFGMLVGRYGDRITRWEVWNEGNCYSEGGYLENPKEAGCTYALPRVLAHLVAESYLRVADRVESGEIQLVLGGLLAQDIWGPLNSGASYLAEVYADGVWGWLEGEHGRRYPWSAVGLHPYVAQDRFTDGTEILAALSEVEAVMAEYGDGAAVAITEMGWQATAGEDVQAENLKVGFAVLGAHPRVDEISWFRYDDAPSANLYYGLVSAEGQPRPALEAMQSLAWSCN